MPTCEVCENDYDKVFEVIVDGERQTFDSFECAIHALAPVCPHCNCRIVGHGVERTDKSSVVSTVHAHPAQRSPRTALKRVGRVTPCAPFQVYERRAGTARASSRLRFNP